MTPRFHLSGLIAALLALMVQLGAIASVPRPDAIAQLAQAETLCHDPGGSVPQQAPAHPLDCLLCPSCIVAHATAAVLLPQALPMPVPSVMPLRREGVPPPATAPPVSDHPPQQPRAPPLTA